MWVLPFLDYRHQYPLTTFDQEWSGALLGMLAAIFALLLSPDYWRNQQVPRIARLPFALIVLVCLQYAMGRIAYFDQALLYILYLMFALTMMLLGAQLRERLGLERIAAFLAAFLLLGAEMSAAIGLLQHFHWHTPLDAVILNAHAVVYGNLAQPNHFADYIALGLASLGLLFQLRKIPPAAVLTLALPLLFVMTLSGSRSSWLYLIAMIALSWKNRIALRYCLGMLFGFFLMHLIVRLPLLAGSVTDWQRFSGEDGSGGIRLYLWHEAWLIFARFPLVGAGFGQFAWQHFLLGPELQRTLITGLYDNAHNLIFQMAAETGIAGLTILLLSLFSWWRGMRRIETDPARWWAYAVLAVLGVHSLLEYPLWYGYFLAIAAVLMGVLDEAKYRIRAAGFVFMGVVAGMFALYQLKAGYQEIKGALVSASAHERDILVSMRNRSILSPWADFYATPYVEVNPDHLEEKLAFNSRVLRFMPVAEPAYLQAYLLAEDGKEHQARTMFEQAYWSYPDSGEKKQLAKLADKDPAHFSSLLKFSLQTEQEYASAIHNN